MLISSTATSIRVSCCCCSQTLRKLKTLDLHGNKLSALKKNQFKNLRDVEILDISYNNITKLDSSHIADLTKMGWCNVSHNALNELTRYVRWQAPATYVALSALLCNFYVEFVIFPIVDLQRNVRAELSVARTQYVA